MIISQIKTFFVTLNYKTNYMTISNEKVVSLVYQLRVDDQNGDIVETVQEDRPFVFLYGAENRGTYLWFFNLLIQKLK